MKEKKYKITWTETVFNEVVINATDEDDALNKINGIDESEIYQEILDSDNVEIEKLDE